MTVSEIRRSFLDFFARHDHRVVASSPLVPVDDPTLLFTNAGMNQFKDLFLGRERRDYTRAATAQKCMRVSGKHNDLDNVGPSFRHHTFFEMLGNFSFGDYFKREAIQFAWTLLTEEWRLPTDRLFATIFRGEGGIPRDEEAYQAWRGLLPAERVGELGASDNFWQMGDTGPCGRCSEIYYYRGPGLVCPEEAAGGTCRGLECSCDRYIEIWNNVFMEFDRRADGALSPLPAPSIDTGMGLERVASVVQGCTSTYDTDAFTPILAAIGARAGTTHRGTLEASDVSMRVVADHIRATTCLIADGVVPSNEWRGYVLRKIMRRAMRHGKKLGLAEPFLSDLAEVVIREMGGAYPELRAGRDAIVRTIRAEEDRFDAVLTSGLPKLEDLLDRTARAGAALVSGDEVFRLYDSLGVPLDFAEDLAGQRGLAIDTAAFNGAMEAQRVRARAKSAFDTKRALAFSFESDEARVTLEAVVDSFEGYDRTALAPTTVIGLFDDERRQVRTLVAGASGFVLLDRTPFYLESGGQVSDVGELRTGDGLVADVTGMSRLSPGGPRLHHVTARANLSVGETISATVDATRRDATRRNHTATHLLHAALRRELGTHVRQAGSLVSPDRLRFDFTHGQALASEERRAIERLVNEQVFRNTPVETTIRKTDEAIGAGAMALFGEKYGDRVRVVSIPDFSVELCGGTHVRATGDIGPFVITEEGGVGSGIRRIEALTGRAAVDHLQELDARFAQTVAALGVGPADALDAVRKLQAESRRLQRENAQLRLQSAMGGSRETADESLTVGDARLVTRRVSGLDKEALRGLSDSIRDRLKRGIVVLAAENDGRVQLLVSVTKDLTDRVKAGQLVKELAPLVGGGGGGRSDFAEAGGKDPTGIDALLTKARELVTAQLGAET
jgi:alanyl-tRNA synthetase